MSPGFLLFLFSLVTIAGGCLMYAKNLPTDYERNTRGITAAVDPLLAAGLRNMRFWRRNWRITGVILAATGIFGLFLSFFTLAQS